MPETGPIYTPENPTPGYTQEQQNLEQPPSIETLPPQNYADTGEEENKEDIIGGTIRGPSGWRDMATLGNLNLANSLVTTPEVQAPDLNPEAQASEFSEATTQGQPKGGEVVTETPNVTEVSTETESLNEVAPETSEIEATEDTEATVTDQISPGLSEKQLKDAEALGAEIRELALNPIEEENLRVAMALAEKYPNGLKISVDKNGNHFVVIKESAINPQYAERDLTIFCKKGIITISNVPVFNQGGMNIGRVGALEKKNLVDFSELINLMSDIKPNQNLAHLRFIKENGENMDVKSSENFFIKNFAELSSDEKIKLKEQMTKAENCQKSRNVANIVDEL